MKKRLCVFASGNGTNMQAILDDIDQGKINGEVVLLITSAKNTGASIRAKSRNIPVVELLLKDFNNAVERDKKIIEVLDEYHIDYIILAGYLGILTKEIISKYPNKIINIHPS
ncbi:MAG TPA: formyltransferase family protein, partial [Clostridia bacterium]